MSRTHSILRAVPSTLQITEQGVCSASLCCTCLELWKEIFPTNRTALLIAQWQGYLESRYLNNKHRRSQVVILIQSIKQVLKPEKISTIFGWWFETCMFYVHLHLGEWSNLTSICFSLVETTKQIFYGMIGGNTLLFLWATCPHICCIPGCSASGGRMAQSPRDFDAGRYDLQSGEHSFLLEKCRWVPLEI